MTTRQRECGHRRPPGARWRIVNERFIVDVEDIDWSNHPGWASDFQAEEMYVDSRDQIPAWADGIIAIERVYLCDECGDRVRRRHPFDED